MKKLHQLVFSGLILFALLLRADNLYAQLVVCDADNPCRVTGEVTPGGNNLVVVNWRGYVFVERNTSLRSSTGTFSSPDNPALGSVNTVLQQAVFPNATGTAVQFNFNESLRVPANVISAATNLGFEQLLFTRRFMIDGINSSASVTININAPVTNPPGVNPPDINPPSSFNRQLSLPEGSEPGASAVAIRHIHLQFSSGSQAEVISENQSLQVLATLHYDRAGMLDAVWEVALPTSTLGQAVYKPLRNIRQNLVGGRQLVLQSPNLPSDIAGLYRVRLRVNTPAMEQPPLELRYQVSKALVRIEPQMIQNVQPAPGAVVNETTLFSWQAQAGSHAYQIEIYSGPETEKPIAGLLLKANTVESALSKSARSKLVAGHVYYWRVIAVNSAGEHIAASERRQIQLQQ